MQQQCDNIDHQRCADKNPSRNIRTQGLPVTLSSLRTESLHAHVLSTWHCASYTKVFNSYLLNELQYLISQFSSLPLLREKVHVGLVTKKNQCSLAFPLGPGLIYIS